MQKRTWQWSIIFVVFLLLVACKGRVPQGQQPLETEAALRLVQTGTQGVELQVLPNYPPPVVYDQNELIALVEVQNKGRHTVEATDCSVQVSGFDPNIILGGLNGPRSCAENVGTLEGKNVYNIEGAVNQIEFRSTNINLPPGVLDYNPTLNFKVCYRYRTEARPSVCVDPLFYQITGEQKACNYRKSVLTGGGQAAPVGVSYVGVNMLGNKAVFEISVVNLGGGRVLSPDVDIQNCDSGLEYTELDKVRYTVQLSSGGSIADCKPKDGLVRLVNNQGKIICTFTIPGSSAYETPLLIDLDYGYIKALSKPIKVVKTPQ